MSKYFLDHDIARIRKARNYQDLLDIALGVLARMRQNLSGPIAMVCGPISAGGVGTREGNLRIFSRAIDRLSGGGLVIFNQMPFEDDMARIYNLHPWLQGKVLLEQFYKPIFGTGYIKLLCFLPGWEESVGATWEHSQAIRLGIPRVYLSEYYTSD